VFYSWCRPAFTSVTVTGRRKSSRFTRGESGCAAWNSISMSGRSAGGGVHGMNDRHARRENAPRFAVFVPALCRRARRYIVGGIKTLSIRYTAALAVGTPPQTTEALLTLRLSPAPVTVRVLPCAVRCTPSTASGLSCPGIRW
jgi:hypothetical protein